MTLTKSGYRRRVVDSSIELMLHTFGGVCVEGPKACGKTWTALNHSNSVMFVSDPANNFQNRKMLDLDVSYALEGECPHLIDEWQEFPSIWDAVRQRSDQSQEKGRYILSGSSTPQRKGIMHTGIGRIGTVRMRPMSLFESGDSSGEVSLRSMFDGGSIMVKSVQRSLRDLVHYAVRGGWPAALCMSSAEYALYNTNYVKMVAGEDAVRLDGINLNSGKIGMLIRSLARNESTLSSNKTLASDMKEYDDAEISQDAVSNYLDVLRRLFITDDQPAYNPNLRSSIRVGKSSKRHLADPSLSIAALGITEEMLANDLNTFGFMFESLCERDLRIYAESSGGSIGHYRDEKGREIDATVEIPGAGWGAFEIKLGTGQIDSAAENLISIKEAIIRNGGVPPSVLCVISGLSPVAYRRDDGVYVCPITALGP